MVVEALSRTEPALPQKMVEALVFAHTLREITQFLVCCCADIPKGHRIKLSAVLFHHSFELWVGFLEPLVLCFLPLFTVPIALVPVLLLFLLFAFLLFSCRPLPWDV